MYGLYSRAACNQERLMMARVRYSFSKKSYFSYRVSHSKEEKVILLWWGHRVWFLLISWVLHVHEIDSFMPNLSIFIFLMLSALYRMICKNSNSFFSKNSLNVPNVNLFSIFFSTFLAFLCIFAENDTLHFTYWVISLASGTSAASMTSTASTTSVASMTSTASFHQKTYWAWCFHQPWHQNDLSWSLNVGWILKNPLFYWFLPPCLLEAVEGAQHQKNKNWWIRHKCA